MLIEVVHFLEGRHPEIVVPIQLLEEPRRSAFLRADAKKVRFCIGIDEWRRCLPVIRSHWFGIFQKIAHAFKDGHRV